MELLAVVWGLEHFRLYIYGKPVKRLTDHQALEPLIKRNRSNKIYTARLTRWLDRLAHFTRNVNHIAGKHLALTDYLSRNPIAPAQNDDVYEEEYVNNSIAPHYGFVSKFGCLNHFNKSQSMNGIANLTKANKHRSSDNTREQNAIHSLIRTPNSDVNILTMDAKIIDNLERIDSSQETANLIERWRNIVKPGIYRLSNGKWKKYHEPKFLRGERKIVEEKLAEIIKRLESPAVEIRNRQNQANYFTDWQFKETGNFQGGFIPQDNQGTSQARPTTSYTPDETPMEEGEISSDSEKAPSVLEVPTINWANYLGVKSVQYNKMGHAPRIQAPEPNDWDQENTVRQPEKNSPRNSNFK